MLHEEAEILWRNLWFNRFSETDIRQRFALGGEEFSTRTQQIPRFMQAHRRASALIDSIFNENCIALIACPPSEKPSRSKKKGFSGLAATGFCAPPLSSWSAVPYPEDQDEYDDDLEEWPFRSYDLVNDQPGRDILLWHVLAHELPIAPHMEILPFFIDPSKQIMMHIYDDRDADIFASTTEVLDPIRDKFHDWLSQW